MFGDVARLGASSSAIVSLERADRRETELRREIVTLQRRVAKLAALLRLALVVRPRSEKIRFGLAGDDGTRVSGRGSGSV